MVKSQVNRALFRFVSNFNVLPRRSGFVIGDSVSLPSMPSTKTRVPPTSPPFAIMLTVIECFPDAGLILACQRPTNWSWASEDTDKHMTIVKYLTTRACLIICPSQNHGDVSSFSGLSKSEH